MSQPSIPQISLVGSESLQGSDLRDLLRTSILGARLKLLGGAEEGTAILSAGEDEPVVIGAIDEAELNASRLVFLAGPAELNQKALSLVRQGPGAPVLIDLTRTLEDHPAARLRAPMAEAEGARIAAPIHVIAHPAAILVATLLQRLSRAGQIRRSVVTAFEPASERGMQGVQELQEQTISLLAFKPLPKAVFDEQLTFNILSHYGEEAPHSLQGIQEGIERHLATLLSAAPTVPMPNLRLLQPAVMHGHTVSMWVLFTGRPDLKALEEALALPPFDYRAAGVTQPNPAGMAAQTGIAVGAVEVDRNEARAVWLHAAADNFRLVSQNAMSAATGFFLEGSPS